MCRDISRRILKPIGGVVLILITGASRGLGKAITERLVEKGEKVVGLARSTESLEIESIKCDVSNYSSVKQAAREVKRMKEPCS